MRAVVLAVFLVACGEPAPAPLPAPPSAPVEEAPPAPATAPACTITPDSPESQDYLKTQLDSGYVKFASDAFGSYSGCTAHYTPGPDGLDAEVALTWKGGEKLSLQAAIPETSIVRLDAPNGFADEQKAIAFLRSEADEMKITMDWTKSETSKDGDLDVMVWWAPEEGMNLSWREMRKSGKLVGLQTSMAL